MLDEVGCEVTVHESLDVSEKETLQVNVEVELIDENGSKDPELELEARGNEECERSQIDRCSANEWSISAERRCGCGCEWVYRGGREEGRARMRMRMGTGGGERGWSERERESREQRGENDRTLHCLP